MVFVGDQGFSIDFPVQFDLSGMEVRLLIQRGDKTETFYDFSAGELAAAPVGGTLSYMVRDSDLSVNGYYLFQPVARDVANGIDLAFKPFSLSVSSRVIAGGWELT